MTTITNLMAQLKIRDTEIKKLKEGKTRDNNTPGTGGKQKQGKRIYDKRGY